MLGQARPAEREAIEQRYLSDRAFLERLEAAECDLIEAYLDGQLGTKDRINFEAQYQQSSERRRRVELIFGLRSR